MGAINTGNVKNMEVALNNIHAKNENAQLENALKEFTEAVLRETSLTVKAKDDIVDQLSVLAAQVAMPEESRIKIVMKALITSIAANIASTSVGPSLRCNGAMTQQAQDPGSTGTPACAVSRKAEVRRVPLAIR